MNTLRETLEKDIIASIIFDPKSLTRLRYSVRPDHFSSPLLRRVYEAMLSLLEDNAEITLANVFLISQFSQSDQRQVEVLSVEGQAGNVGLLSRKLSEEMIREKLMKFKNGITEEADLFEMLKKSYEIETEASAIIQLSSRKNKLQTLHEYAKYLQTNSSGGVNEYQPVFRASTGCSVVGLHWGTSHCLVGRPVLEKPPLLCELRSTLRRMASRQHFFRGK
jgi:replicative DNA helicase